MIWVQVWVQLKGSCGTRHTASLYSSELQRATSIEDQIRQCRNHAKHEGWEVLEDFVLADKALSDATMAGREALDKLVTAAKTSPRLFDCLLIDDTSRLGRNIADVLKIGDIFRFHGVFLFFVSQKLDSRNESFRQLHIFSGMMDEQYSVGLRDKVHRGQEGRVLNGYHPGGKCYGYRNVPEFDPNCKSNYGRAAVTGVKLAIIEEQAAIVRRIFEMYADGYGLARIAKRLNKEGIQSPQPPRKTPHVHGARLAFGTCCETNATSFPFGSNDARVPMGWASQSIRTLCALSA